MNACARPDCGGRARRRDTRGEPVCGSHWRAEFTAGDVLTQHLLSAYGGPDAS